MSGGQHTWQGLLLALAAMFATAPMAKAEEPQTLNEFDQGWSDDQQTAWWGATQGSRLIPLDWFKALEIEGGSDLFASTAVLSRFGFLPRPGVSQGALPIGFAIDTQSDERFKRTRLRWKAPQRNDEKWVGLTCSACHTGALQHDGRSYLVEGAGGVLDFQGFVETLNRSLSETQSDTTKWDRFASRVLAGANNDENKAQLKASFDSLLAWQKREEDINAAPIRYGPGRIDAFGHIFNKVALTLDPQNARKNPADAPVSIPFIWRAPQLDRVQYNGIAPKVPILGGFDVGAVGRNTGEVIGVFGDVVPHPDPGLFAGFASSVRVNQLAGLESVLAELRPPLWPKTVFGAIDQAKADRGSVLFDTHRCSSCHTPVDRTDVSTRLNVEMSLFNGEGTSTRTGEDLEPPGTDPWMACNSYAYRSSPGVLRGFRSKLLTEDATLSRTSEEPLAKLLKVTVASVLLDQKAKITREAVRRLFQAPRLPEVEEIGTAALPRDNVIRSMEKQARFVECMTRSDANLGYTSRPLNGIWATGPFLHNGSVPNLYELLLPPEARLKSFHVGTREFDAEKLGYRTDAAAPGNAFEFQTHDSAGRLIDGNSNDGHDYGNSSLTDEQRFELIEYLKSI